MSLKLERCPFSIGPKFRAIEYVNGEGFLESLGAEADVELGENIVLSVMKRDFKDYAFTFTLTARKTGIGLRFTPEERNLVSGVIITRDIGEVFGIPIQSSFIRGKVDVDDDHGH